jgi:tetratricopeptide (TPR) repeat protein
MVLKWLAGRLKAKDASPSLLQQAQALRSRGDYEGARAACQEVLREDPQPPRQTAAMALMAALAADQRQTDNGLQWAARALAIDRHCVAAHFARGRLLEGAERYPEAEASYRQVTLLDSRDAKAQTNLGCMLHIQGRLDEAVKCYRRALELEPGQPEALRNYTLVVGGADGLQEAVAGYQHHLASHPADAAAHHQLAHLQLRLGRHDEALAGYRQAIALQPDEPEFHFALAQHLLLLGQYEEAWREYAWRWRMERFNAPMRRFTQPLWEGQPLAGATLLVHGESGLGDTFLLVRYAALAAQRGARVVVECQPALKVLVAGVPGVAQAVAQGEALPAFDLHIPFIALPERFASTLDTIPWSGPYVQADPARLVPWAQAVATAAPRRRRVGLVWTGNPENLGNRERSVTLQQLGTLADAGDITFFSLQKGVDAAARGPVPPGMHFVDLTDGIRDFGDTAALLTQLDLLVTVDTSVLHLAGAMGRPTWALLPFSPPWLYHVDRAEHPWYPGMRLFRQPTEGDWDTPLGQLRQALADWAEG